MASWRLAKGLAKLKQQINDRWPNRSKVSDGTIGDASHQARASASDHNPDSRGIVCAIDITKDEADGPNLALLAEALIKDARCKYVIYTGRIWKARTGKWETYRGPNPHNKHLHISVQGVTADDESTWALTTNITPLSYPLLKLGDRGQMVRQLQDRLRLNGFSVATDGILGRISESAIKQFQQREGLTVTGTTDGATWAKLMEDR